MPSKSPEPTTVEQYIYEKRDGLSAKLAVRYDRDKQKSNRMNALEWDEHHCTWSDDFVLLDGTTGAWTLDRSPESLEYLRTTVGLGIPPTEEIPWNVSAYATSPGSNPRECEACGEESVLGLRGLRASGYRRTVLDEALSVPYPDSITAPDPQQVCTSCRQFYEYQVHERETSADGGVTAGTVTSETPLHEVM